MLWPGTVEVGTRIDRIGRSSVTLGQALFVGDDCVATCHSVVVLIDASTRRSSCLPTETVTALEAIIDRNPHVHGMQLSRAPPSRSVRCSTRGKKVLTLPLIKHLLGHRIGSLRAMLIARSRDEEGQADGANDREKG
jgi:hypothetical protein